MLTAMEYQRADKSEKGKNKKSGKRKSNVQISNSTSFVDENESPKTRVEELAGFVSRWKVPRLKTLGRLLTNSQPSNS